MLAAGRFPPLLGLELGQSRQRLHESGPLAGLAVSRSRPAAGGWIVAATMAGALVFGVANHFIIDAADHVSHVEPRWRALFTATAVLLAVTELGGAVAGVLYAVRRAPRSPRFVA